MRILNACFTTAVLLGSVSVESQELIRYEKPAISASKMIEARSKIDFDKLALTSRSSGVEIYQRALPSVVKILTNEGSGSGVVLSREGFILTNEHVISGYGTVGVVLSSDGGYENIRVAKVIKFDEVKDLALIKFNQEVTGLIPIKITADVPQVGADVHAIGHPLGEDWTYTRGYISQYRKNYKWKTGTLDHHVANVIQTQTPINPGNSGGPLLNENGELIGINSFGNTNAQGINFAVEISSVEEFLATPGSNKRAEVRERIEQLLDSRDVNNNGNPDVYIYDLNSNKVADLLGFDLDEDQRIELLKFDENENQIIEMQVELSRSPDYPGIFYSFDEDEDENFESGGIDEDSDGVIDSFFPL
jgi:S1-C subfamily serine protease